MARDHNAENRIFRKRLYAQKLLFGGCRAWFSGLETIWKNLKNFRFWLEIYDFVVFFRNLAKTAPSQTPSRTNHSANERSCFVPSDSCHKKFGKVWGWSKIEFEVEQGREIFHRIFRKMTVSVIKNQIFCIKFLV